jgi:hypothetical protein
MLLSQPAGQLAAQENDPITSSGAEYSFGQIVSFHLAANKVTEVVAVTLFFQAPELPNTFSASVPFEPGHNIEVSYSVSLSQVRLAPFTTVTYWWVLTTDSGKDILVPEQSFSYDDDRFAWKQVRQEGFSISWNDDDPSLGQLALDIVGESLPRVQAVIPGVEVSPLRFYIYQSSADVRAALRLTGRDWVGGHADPELGVILLTAVNPASAPTDLRRNIPHEMTHFYLYQATGHRFWELPAWFNEGLATFMEAKVDPRLEATLHGAVVAGTTIDFAELCETFPTTEERALLAYAQSASLIRYIQAHYGTQKLSDMVGRLIDGADCNSVVNRSLSISLAELQRSWLHGQPGARSPWLELVSENSLWLALFAAGFGLSRLLILNPPKQPNTSSR